MRDENSRNFFLIFIATFLGISKLRHKWLVAMLRLFDDFLVEIGVDAPLALVLSRVVDAAPVDLVGASLLAKVDVAVVL